PFLNTLVPVLADQFADVFPELKAQQDFVAKVIEEEEIAFLRTIENGLKKLHENIKGKVNENLKRLTFNYLANSEISISRVRESVSEAFDYRLAKELKVATNTSGVIGFSKGQEEDLKFASNDFK